MLEETITTYSISMIFKWFFVKWIYRFSIILSNDTGFLLFFVSVIFFYFFRNLFLFCVVRCSLAVLPDHFAIKNPKKFQKKPDWKAIYPVVINNVFLTKTKCLKQSNARHLAIEVVRVSSSRKMLVLSLCSGRSRLFKQCYWLKMNLSVVHFVRCTGY